MTSSLRTGVDLSGRSFLVGNIGGFDGDTVRV
jgi:hypothetical protein